MDVYIKLAAIAVAMEDPKLIIIAFEKLEAMHIDICDSENESFQKAIDLYKESLDIFHGKN